MLVLLCVIRLIIKNVFNNCLSYEISDGSLLMQLRNKFCGADPPFMPPAVDGLLFASLIRPG